jgi:hypothetical protein
MAWRSVDRTGMGCVRADRDADTDAVPQPVAESYPDADDEPDPHALPGPRSDEDGGRRSRRVGLFRGDRPTCDHGTGVRPAFGQHRAKVTIALSRSPVPFATPRSGPASTRLRERAVARSDVAGADGRGPDQISVGPGGRRPDGHGRGRRTRGHGRHRRIAVPAGSQRAQAVRVRGAGWRSPPLTTTGPDPANRCGADVRPSSSRGRPGTPRSPRDPARSQRGCLVRSCALGRAPGSGRTAA